MSKPIGEAKIYIEGYPKNVSVKIVYHDGTSKEAGAILNMVVGYIQAAHPRYDWEKSSKEEDGMVLYEAQIEITVKENGYDKRDYLFQDHYSMEQEVYSSPLNKGFQVIMIRNFFDKIDLITY